MPYTDDGTGYRDVDTSRKAAAAVEGGRRQIWGRIEDLLRARGSMTADDIAGALGADRLSVRPRLTELRDQGRVVDSGLRGKSAMGKSAIKWQVKA